MTNIVQSLILAVLTITFLCMVAGNTSTIEADFVSGSGQAFSALYNEHAAPVLAFLVGRLKDRASAEDCLQETWTKVWRSRHQYEPGSNFRAWLFRVANTVKLDHQRKQARRPTTELLEGDGVDKVRRTDGVRSDELDALRECLQEQGGDFVDVFRRVKVDDESPVDVANELGVARGTVDSRVNRAKKIIASCVEGKLA